MKVELASFLVKYLVHKLRHGFHEVLHDLVGANDFVFAKLNQTALGCLDRNDTPMLRFITFLRLEQMVIIREHASAVVLLADRIVL